LSAAAMRPVRRRHKAAGGLPAALHAVQGHLARVTLPAIFRTNTSMCAGWGRVWRRCRVSARLEHQLGVATRRERLRHGRVVHGGHQRVKARRADRDQHGAAARGRGRCALGARARRGAGHAGRAGCRIGRGNAGCLQGRTTGMEPLLRAARRAAKSLRGGRHKAPGPLAPGLLRAGGGRAAGARTNAAAAALRRFWRPCASRPAGSAGTASPAS